MDESPEQLIGETKTLMDAKPGIPAKHDYWHVRHVSCIRPGRNGLLS
jgi:hypothetical protein